MDDTLAIEESDAAVEPLVNRVPDFNDSDKTLALPDGNDIDSDGDDDDDDEWKKVQDLVKSTTVISSSKTDQDHSAEISSKDDQQLETTDTKAQLKKESTVCVADEEIALPDDRKRKLPGWMQGLTSEESFSEEKPKKGRGRPKKGITKNSGGISKTGGGRGRSKPSLSTSKQRTTDNADDLSPDGSATSSQGNSRVAPRRAAAARRISYADDDYVIESDNDDKIDVKNKQSPSKRGRGRPPSKTTPHKYKHSDEEDNESSSSDEGSDSDWDEKKSKKSPLKGRKGSLRKSNDSDNEFAELYVPRPSKRRQPSGKESENDKNIASTSKQEKRSKKSNKKRDQCEHGGKCYRKNAAHKRELSHPGDSDWQSEESDDNNDDDDKTECEFGTDCYRKNPEHINAYTHTRPPKRKAATKVVDEKGTEGSSEIDTYDYNDSFIDDKDDPSQNSLNASATNDVDAVEDDVGLLQKETKSFKKNKKQQQAV